MTIQIAYWHWLVFGMLLIIAELFVPSFTILWFGLAAVVVSGLLLAIPGMAFTWQIFIWAIASCLMTFLWFKLIRPRMKDRTHAGIAKEALVGQSGQVIQVPMEGRKGVVRFAIPLLGSDEWPFVCSQTVTAGDRVTVKDISGNTLVMEKQSAI